VRNIMPLVVKSVSSKAFEFKLSKVVPSVFMFLPFTVPVVVKEVAFKVVNEPAAAELPPITVPSIAPPSILALVSALLFKSTAEPKVVAIKVPAVKVVAFTVPEVCEVEFNVENAPVPTVTVPMFPGLAQFIKALLKVPVVILATSKFGISEGVKSSPSVTKPLLS